MRRNIHRACMLLLALAWWPGVAAQDEGSEPMPDEADAPVSWSRPPRLPEAAELMASVRSALPAEPLRIEAELESKDRRGAVEKKLQVAMRLAWHPSAPEAEYTIRDAFGGPLERLTVSHRPPDATTYTYASGDPPQPAGLPDLNTRIQNTDISWLDLSLSFLWWPGGTTVGAEKVKGRFCYVVDVPPPGGTAATLSGMRLWIDPKTGLMLQAAAFDARGAVARQLLVKSLKKVAGLWLVKDIEVRSLPSRHKTVLRVREVAAGSRPGKG